MECLNQKSRTKSSTAMLACVALVFACVMSIVARSASAAKDEYIFCFVGDIQEEMMYYSAMFRADYSRVTRVKLDFHSYLEDTGKNPNFPPICFFGRTYEDAKRKLERQVRQHQMYPYSEWTILPTNWKPGYSAPQQPSDDDVSPDRESGGDGCYFGECPDGMDASPQSPNTPIPSQESPQRTLICQTPDGWCEMAAELPMGVPCGCATLSGPIGGITVP